MYLIVINLFRKVLYMPVEILNMVKPVLVTNKTVLYHQPLWTHSQKKVISCKYSNLYHCKAPVLSLLISITSQECSWFYPFASYFNTACCKLVIDVASGGPASLFLGRSGTVYGVGLSVFGEKLALAPEPVQLPGRGLAVFAGGRHFFVVRFF